VLNTGEVWCWDEGTTGHPEMVPGLLPFARQVLGSRSSGCALAGTNGVQCWGTNADGQLGNHLASSATPVFVPMGEPVRELTRSVSPNYFVHTCALLESGAVRCWGDNLYGQLGLPPLRESWNAVPVRQ
jgi:alpha-tubulin suppressor-like RCC1 family protein